jgi:hypothetical protein
MVRRLPGGSRISDKHEITYEMVNIDHHPDAAKLVMQVNHGKEKSQPLILTVLTSMQSLITKTKNCRGDRDRILNQKEKIKIKTNTLKTTK